MNVNADAWSFAHAENGGSLAPVTMTRRFPLPHEWLMLCGHQSTGSSPMCLAPFQVRLFEMPIAHSWGKHMHYLSLLGFPHIDETRHKSVDFRL